MPAASIAPLLVENERPDFFGELKNDSSEERLWSDILYFLKFLTQETQTSLRDETAKQVHMKLSGTPFQITEDPQN